ncbi:hypothetical protein [Aeromonas veronii]|uniref:Uncharacterized protein n=1 Tax=Aeromonas veronii TaxID=654 RepID=A0A4S5CKP2_AERVE|nr:hypothetical protein [Aeromonas veronii]THJ44945.1 hypothetical protein E8Q35_12205 [Aeromonas veronii]
MTKAVVQLDDAQRTIEKLAQYLDNDLGSSLRERIETVIIESQALIGMLLEPQGFTEELNEQLDGYHQKNLGLLALLKAHANQRSKVAKGVFGKALTVATTNKQP